MIRRFVYRFDFLRKIRLTGPPGPSCQPRGREVSPGHDSVGEDGQAPHTCSKCRSLSKGDSAAVVGVGQVAGDVDGGVAADPTFGARRSYDLDELAEGGQGLLTP